MKIAIDCRSSFPGRGGIGRYAENLGRRIPLLDQNNNYVILTTDRQKEKICSYEKVQQMQFPTGMIDPLWEQTCLPSILKEHAINLYHNPCFSLPIAKEKLKLVTTIHDVVFREKPELVEEKLCAYLDRWTQVACKIADAIITVSEYSKRQLIRYYDVSPNKIEVIYNGIDAKFKKASPMQCSIVCQRYRLPEKFLLYLGSIEPKKNIERLLEAMQIIKEKHRDYPLVIAGGKGSKQYDIENAIQKLKLKDSVLLIGYVDESDVVPLLSQANIFIYPSLYEGFGFPPLEAMACGTPTIVSNATSLPEIVGSSALVFDAEDSQSLASAIERLLSDNQEYMALVWKGKSQAEKFRWEECARRTLDVYSKVMER